MEKVGQARRLSYGLDRDEFIAINFCLRSLNRFAASSLERILSPLFSVGSSAGFIDSRFRGNDREGRGNDREGCGNDREDSASW